MWYLIVSIPDLCNLTYFETAFDYSALSVDTDKVIKAAKEAEEAKCRRLPDIVIVAFEKCGTMTLRQFLAIHPRVYISNNRDNNRLFISEDDDIKKLYENFSCTPDHKLRLEKLATPTRADLVYKHLPNVKIIAVYLNSTKTPKLRKDTQSRAKTCKDTQRHTKTCKDTQIFACLCPSLCVFVNFKRFFAAFACLCVSLRVFARLCPSLRVFVCLCVVWVSLRYLDRPDNSYCKRTSGKVHVTIPPSYSHGET